MSDIDEQDDLCAPLGVEEEELSLPRASINKMIKEMVSSVLKLSFLFVCLNFKIILGPSHSGGQREQRAHSQLLYRVHSSHQLGGQRDL